jgi:hypothetical protein
MTRLELQSQIKALREELETRHKTGVVKTGADGKSISAEKLQAEMYSLIYKLSKME